MGMCTCTDGDCGDSVTVAAAGLSHLTLYTVGRQKGSKIFKSLSAEKVLVLGGLPTHFNIPPPLYSLTASLVYDRVQDEIMAAVHKACCAGPIPMLRYHIPELIPFHTCSVPRTLIC